MPEPVPEMVERGARAAYKNQCKKVLSPTPYTWDEAPEDGKNEYREAARAVIEAMREPTEAMRKIGQEWAYYSGARDSEVAMTDIWDAMIDAALEGRAMDRLLDRKDKG